MALEKEEDKALKDIFTDINALKVDVAYPLLLELYEDYKNGLIQKAEFREMLKLVESYVFRRAICGIPTNSLNKTFANFNREIDKGNYLEDFKAALVLKDSYRRFPNDNEFKQQLMVKDLYNSRSCNYWLRKLENHDRKEKVNVGEYTIEHIMPQNENLSDEWRNDLGDDWEDIHSKYLHTLGNLTLTGYNSELSNKPFIEKRDLEGGFRDSPFKLNKGLGQLEHWNKDKINKRAARLADLAVQVWECPNVADEVLERHHQRKERKKERVYTLEVHPHLTGEMLELFNQLSRRILNLDSSVTQVILKRYITYRAANNFALIVPQQSRLRLTLNLKFSEIDDPNGVCRDITNTSKWGDVEVGINSLAQFDDIMYLIKQSFDNNSDDGND